MDVWSDDVLKEILSETRRRRSHRRWLRAASVSAALVAGIGLALFVARSTDEVPANSKTAAFASERVQPAAVAAAPSSKTGLPGAETGLPSSETGFGSETDLKTAGLAKADRTKGGMRIDLGSIVEPIVAPLAITPVSTPGSGITQAVVDVLLFALPDGAPASGGDLAAANTHGVAAAPEPIEPLVEDEIRPGDTLLAALSRHGVAASTAFAIARELEPHFDLRRSRPGHRYRIERDEQGGLIAFRYAVSDLEHYQVTQQNQGWETRAAKRGVIRQQARLAGVVATTLYDAIGDLGERPELAAEFANIFAWDVDFAKGVHSGDEFHLVYERNYVAREGGGGLRYVGPGRILAARYQSGGRTHQAIYYETEPGVGNYYREDGSPVQQGFLAAPVKYTRISSSFTHARFHPILRKTRPHPGIDYAAPVGTPVWAVAEGRVTHAGAQ